jgi:hypothetical protein
LWGWNVAQPLRETSFIVFFILIHILLSLGNFEIF